MHKLSASQYLALERLKRSHTNLHHAITRMQESEPTEKSKADIAKIITELSYVLVKL